MKTVIEMAREAAAMHGHTFKDVPETETIEFITAFDQLVRTDERNSWPAEMEAMERQVNILTDALAQSKAEENEACAKVCDAAYDEFFANHEFEYPKARYDQASVTRTVKAAIEFVTEDVAKAIRARKDNT